jgi:hypothetical protein
LRGHYNQKLLCGKKKKVDHASLARFDRLGGVTGSGVKHVSESRLAKQSRAGRRGLGRMRCEGFGVVSVVDEACVSSSGDR